jgi:RNA polymerase sigma-70 factor, ECF subfamily
MNISSAARLSSPSLTGDRDNEPYAWESDGAGGSDVSDEVLLSRVLQSDADALGSLFRRYAKVVHSIGRRLLRDEAEAEDLVQDVFLYVRRKCGVYNPEKGTASSWIVQTIYYQALRRRMLLASRNRYSSFTIENAGQDTRASSMVMEYDQSLEGMIGRTRLREMLDCLTEDQWGAIRLHFFEGYTLSEIAQKRGQTVGNIRHHFYRGIEKLRSRVFCSELQDRVTNGTR